MLRTARPRPLTSLLVFCVVLCVVLCFVLWACSGDPVAVPIDRSLDAADTPGAESVQETPTPPGPARILSPPLGPKPAVAADPDLLHGIREFLQGGGRRVPCGPYNLWTDLDDPFLLVELDQLASRLDAEYEARLGLTPYGPVSESIVLFARLRDFQSWEAQHSGSRRGYAGHAAASEGIAVLHADRPRDDVLATTVHEMTHLVNRRALGGPLPRWLGEGLADALGDSASAHGFLPLDGALGIEGELDRVQAALRAGYDVPTVADLVGKSALSFDRSGQDGRSYDYELSALFVRYLLSQPDRAMPFRAYLAELASGGRWSPDGLWQGLGTQPTVLDPRFRSWLLELHTP